MRVLLYGETQSKGTGAWCYAQTIRQLGHELLEYSNTMALDPYDHSLAWKAIRKLNQRQVIGFHQRRHAAGLLKLAEEKQPDMVIILKGLHLGKKDIKKLREFSPFVVNVNHDDFFSFNPNNRSRRQFEALPEYDYLFTTRGVNVPELKKYNPRSELFMFAWFPDIHHIPELTGEEEQRFESDVLFIGTYEKARAAMLEKLMKGSTFKLAIYGNDWHHLDRKSFLHQYIKSYRGIWMQDMAKAIRCARITLGFLRKENRDEYTQRSFEIPACGGLLLAERSDFHRQLFRENREAVFFDADNTDELRQKINYLLSHPTEAGKIRMAGHQKIITGNFSYADRIAQLESRFNAFARKNIN